MPIAAFLRDETGAVTVDYVMLTAAVMMVGAFSVWAISGPTEDRATDFRDRQVQVWRKGEFALANYTPYNEPGFFQMFDAINSMSGEDRAVLNAFSNSVQQNGTDGLSENDQRFLNELDNAVSIHHAETRTVRMETTDFDPSALEGIWDSYDFDDAADRYGASADSGSVGS